MRNKKETVVISENASLVIMLFLTFCIFTFIGAGSIIIVSCAGLFLCMTGFVQSSVKVDLWILVPLLIYTAISFLSGYRVYETTDGGLASTQAVFPIVYLLVSYLDNHERSMLKRLCAIWTGVMAGIGIGQFTMAAFSGTATRLSGLMGNPNAMGFMMVLGWFAIQSSLSGVQGDSGYINKLLQGLEFITLTALALTLSIGSFCALGTGVIAMHICEKGSLHSFLLRIAKIIFAGGCGILLYIAGDMGNSPFLCVVLCVYILAAAFYRNEMNQYFAEHRWLNIFICFAGIIGAGGLIFLRPNAAATFAERLAMIKNGLGYIGENPLLGIGPYQWRLLNLQDADTYFNTWHIHNVFVHIGVELGLIALSMLIIISIRCILKKDDTTHKSMFFAALIHNMMDTSFFYMATVPFLMLTAAEDKNKTYHLNTVAAKGIFLLFFVIFSYNLLQCL